MTASLKLLWAVPMVVVFGFITVALVSASFAHAHLSSVDMKSIDDVVLFENASAQMSATFAGFLVVGLLFLIRRRDFSFRTPGWKWKYLDILFLAGAVWTLAGNAFNSLLHMAYALSQDEVTPAVMSQVRLELATLILALALFGVGIGLAVGISMGRNSERETARTTEQEEDDN